MDAASHQLTFELLDDLLLAQERGRCPAVALTPSDSIGPELELAIIAPSLKSLFASAPTALEAAQVARKTRLPVYRFSKRMGVVVANRLCRQGQDLYRDAFMFEMHKVMRALDWPSTVAAGIVDAMGEMESNIHEHSQAADTGLIAYRVTAREAEWVVVDRGIGVLRSLSEGAYPSLTDAGEALRMALTDGCSRHSLAGRGNGFRAIFKALSARHGRMRFRSDDQLLTIEGVSPVLSRSRLDQRANVPGFAVSVMCARSG